MQKISWKYLQGLTEPVREIGLVEAICVFLVKKKCMKYYTVADDGTVSVVGKVNLSDKELKTLPVYFHSVGGRFVATETN
jgi:hypothetical protein